MTIEQLMTDIDDLFNLGIEIGTERQKLGDIANANGTMEPITIAQSNSLDDLVARHMKLREKLLQSVTQLVDLMRQHYPR